MLLVVVLICNIISATLLLLSQGMAGNIIHAIATTNAIVGGIIVSEALKILAGQRSSTHRDTHTAAQVGVSLLVNVPRHAVWFSLFPHFAHLV